MGARFARAAQRFVAAPRFDDTQAVCFHEVGQRLPVGAVVVNDQDRLFRHRRCFARPVRASSSAGRQGREKNARFSERWQGCAGC
jgi:hypothetical protein